MGSEGLPLFTHKCMHVRTHISAHAHTHKKKKVYSNNVPQEQVTAISKTWGDFKIAVIQVKHDSKFIVS